MMEAKDGSHAIASLQLRWRPQECQESRTPLISTPKIPNKQGGRLARVARKSRKVGPGNPNQCNELMGWMPLFERHSIIVRRLMGWTPPGGIYVRGYVLDTPMRRRRPWQMLS